MDIKTAAPSTISIVIEANEQEIRNVIAAAAAARRRTKEQRKLLQHFAEMLDRALTSAADGRR